jgi:hypothetical protein
MADEPTGPAAPPPQDEQRRQMEQLIQGAILGPVPKFYANGVGIAQTASDISLVLLMHNQPIGVVTMSYVTMKSIWSDLSPVLEAFEKATGQKIQTISEVNADMSKAVATTVPIDKPPPSARRRPKGN